MHSATAGQCLKMQFMHTKQGDDTIEAFAAKLRFLPADANLAIPDSITEADIYFCTFVMILWMAIFARKYILLLLLSPFKNLSIAFLMHRKREFVKQQLVLLPLQAFVLIVLDAKLWCFIPRTNVVLFILNSNQ